MKTIAYLRVSTYKQDSDHQKLAILDYSQKHRVVIDEFIQLKISSNKSTKDRKIDELLEKLNQEDTIIVSELSRLGRSLSQIIRLIDELIKRKIKLIAIKENIVLREKQDIQSKVMIALFGLFAEIEKDLISERTKEALAAAKAKGKLLGRPKGFLGKSRLDGKENEIKNLLEKKVSKSSIAKILGVSRTTIFHFIQSRKLK